MGKSNALDFWPTQSWIVDRMCQKIINKKGTFLDNSCGKGAFIEGLIRLGIKQTKITAYDIDESNIAYCKKIWPEVKYIHEDFLNATINDYDTSIFNPPYSKYKEFLDKSYIHSNQVITIIPNNWAHIENSYILSHIYEEDYDIKYLASFGIQQCLSIFDIRKETNNSKNKIKDYFNGLEDYIRLLKEGRTVKNNMVKLENQKFGIVVSTHSNFTNSGCAPKGTKIILPPFIISVETGEKIKDPLRIIRNGKLENGESLDFIKIRRHGNDKVKVGSRKTVYILDCKDEEELNKLIDFYDNYSLSYLKKVSSFDSSNIVLVPIWYKPKMILPKVF
jgi:SAM-dependent methyltransferase